MQQIVSTLKPMVDKVFQQDKFKPTTLAAAGGEEQEEEKVQPKKVCLSMFIFCCHNHSQFEYVISFDCYGKRDIVVR
jgi:hypothetical protein